MDDLLARHSGDQRDGGGIAMDAAPDLWRNVGADGFPADTEGGVLFARQMWDQLPPEKRL